MVLRHLLQDEFPQDSGFATEIENQIFAVKLKHSLEMSDDFAFLQQLKMHNTTQG